MNNKTLFYGFLIAGGLLAYYAFKKNSEKNITSPTSTSGTFVDDVSVLSETGGIKGIKPEKETLLDDVSVLSETGGIKGIKPEKETLIEDVKNSVSKIVDPFIAENKILTVQTFES